MMTNTAIWIYSNKRLFIALTVLFMIAVMVALFVLPTAIVEAGPATGGTY
jgi:hypothetical protein